MRKEILQSLVNLSVPIDEIRKQLRSLPWDCKEEYIITKAEILLTLQKVSENRLSEQDLITWAELIEGRDDIGFGDDETLKNLIYEIANPTLFGKLDIKSWIEKLGDSSS